VIRDRSEELRAFYTEHFGEPEVGRRVSPNGRHSERTDEEIIELARSARNAEKFARLFDRGETSEYGGDESRADQALVSILSFYSQDQEQLDRLFRQSALCRDKWLSRPDYRDLTIQYALENLKETYVPDDGAQMVIGAKQVSSPSSPLYMSDSDDTESGFGSDSSIVLFSELGDPEPREFLVEDVLPARYATVMHGGGGAAKSVLVLLLGMVVASGAEEWLGLRVHKGGHVLYLDFELDVAEQHRRVRDLAAGLRKPVPEKLAYLSALGMNTQEAFEAALGYCRERGVVLLILDSLGPAMLGDVETARDVIRFHNAYVGPFRAEGVTVVIVDHQGKLQAGEAYQNKSSFGSAYKEHLVRSVLQVEAHGRDREAGTLDVRVRHKKASFGPRREPFDVKLVFGHESIEAHSVKLDDTELAAEGTINAEDRIAHALRDGPAYPDELVDATGLALGTVKNCLTRLRRAGQVIDTGETRGQTRQVRLVSSPSLIYRGSDSDDANSASHSETGEQEIGSRTQPSRDVNDRRRRVRELFEAPPRWLQIQATKYLEEGAPERLLTPLAAAVAHELLGNPRRGEEVVDDVREALKERGGAA
jgi:hypothetical protein